jgi:hypothetical protein
MAGVADDVVRILNTAKLASEPSAKVRAICAARWRPGEGACRRRSGRSPRGSSCRRDGGQGPPDAVAAVGARGTPRCCAAIVALPAAATAPPRPPLPRRRCPSCSGCGSCYWPGSRRCWTLFSKRSPSSRWGRGMGEGQRRGRGGPAGAPPLRLQRAGASRCTWNTRSGSRGARLPGSTVTPAARTPQVDPHPSVRRWLAEFCGAAAKARPSPPALRAAAQSLGALIADDAAGVALAAALAAHEVLRLGLALHAVAPVGPRRRARGGG